MARSINTVVLTGYATADAELKGEEGTVATFDIALNETYKKDGKYQERTDFAPCVCYGKLAQGLAKHVKKGVYVQIEAKLRQSRWETEDGKRSRIQVEVKSFNVFNAKPKSADEEAGE